MPFQFNGYTNFHGLNLDWIISKIKHIDDVKEAVDASETNAAASAADSQTSAEASQASAEASQASAEASQASAEASQASAEASAAEALRTEGTAENLQNAFNVLNSRVDNIIPSGTQTEGNTELIDIRVAHNGVIYPSAGDSVRNQVTQITDHMEYITPVNWFNENETESLDDTYEYTNYIPVENADTLDYYWSNNSFSLAHGTPRYWMYYDAARNKLGETAAWTQSYTVSSNSVKFVRAVLNKTQINRMIEINQDPPVTVYEPYFAPYYISSEPAAAAANDKIVKLINDGESYIEGVYKKGTLVNGDYAPLNYRVAETELVTFKGARTVHIANGFRAGFHLFLNNAFVADSGWKTGYYVVPKGYSVKIVIARQTEDTSENITDIDEFIDALSFKPYVANSPLIENKCCLDISHQGFSVTTEYYGNSRLSSYRGSFEHGFKCAETDIQWSSDNVPVCCHDPAFASGGVDIVIAEHTAAELKTYDYYGETIATLEEVLEACKTYGLKLELDKIVGAWTDAQFAIVFNLVNRYQMQKYVIWTAPDDRCIEKILGYDPEATMMFNTNAGYLTATIENAQSKVTEKCNIMIACNYSGLTVNDLISANELCTEKNITIGVWTIDDIATYKLFLPYAAFITSNKLTFADTI